MNFLNSAFLAGLAAAAIPLLIHLLNRRRLKTIEFSSVMFLRDLRKTRMRRLQLRRWLLLLVRTLLIAMAVLAFARPALRGGIFAALGSRARTTAVVALDRSASMALETQNGTAYDRALRRLNETSDLWGEGDEAIALPFSAPVPASTAPASADFDALRKRLGELTVSGGGTDAGAAVTTALTALAETENLNRELYLFSDFRREGFIKTVVPPPTDLRAENVTLYLIDVAEPGGFDLSVNSVTIANQLLQPGSPFAISASVSNHTERPVDRILVSLFVDGRRVGQREANLPAAGATTASFTASVETPGVHTGFIEISADDNAQNNRRYFTLTIPEQIDVLLSSDYPSGRIAMRLALAPRGHTDARFRVTEVDTDALIRENVFDYDAVVITEWRSPQPAVVEHLQRYIRAGGGVFVAPSVDADTTAWNTLIATPQFGLRLGPRPAPPTPSRFFVWDRFDWNHPIWSVYGGVDNERIPEVRWHAIFRTEGTHTGETVVGFSGGRPALSETQIESGKLLALWTPMSAAYTNLPLRSIFVPFANRLVEYLAADLSERRSDFVAGEAIIREPARSLPPEATVEVIAPDGTRLLPGIEREGTQIRISLAGIEEPGAYLIVAPTLGDLPIDAFSVNCDPQESDATVITNEELKRRWADYNLVFVPPDRALAGTVNQTRYGTEIRPAFLWIVAGLFLLEMLLARTRRRDRPLETGSPIPAAATASTN
jgi:hypothetical protein